MDEKHTIRNGIVISVVSGLILAVLFSSWLRGICATIFHWLWSVIVYIASFFTHKVNVPIWLLLVIIFLAIILMRIIQFFIKGDECEDHTEDYTQDSIFGVVWRWNMSYGNIHNLMAFCPRCDLELVYHEQRHDHYKPSRLYPAEFTQFECENCSIGSDKINGEHLHYLDRVEREIRRRYRTGEWKQEKEVEIKR